jgi:hypothetical protein
MQLGACPAILDVSTVKARVLLRLLALRLTGSDAVRGRGVAAGTTPDWFRCCEGAGVAAGTTPDWFRCCEGGAVAGTTPDWFRCCEGGVAAGTTPDWFRCCEGLSVAAGTDYA